MAAGDLVGMIPASGTGKGNQVTRLQVHDVPEGASRLFKVAGDGYRPPEDRQCPGERLVKAKS